MKFLIVVLSFFCMAGDVLVQASDAEDCSDQSSLLLLRTGLDFSRTVPAVAEPVLPGRGGSCAVCFIGELRNLNETSDLLRRNLLEPIASGGVKVDVFVAAPKKGPFGIADFGLKFHADTNGQSRSNVGIGSDENEDTLHRFAIRDFRWQPEPSIDELQDAITKSAPRQAMELYKSGKISLGPLFGSSKNELRIYNHGSECLQMIEQHEQAQHIRYDWVMRTRPDFMWISPHPPLSLISADMLWTFDSEQYGAVNDRHVVGGRDVVFDGDLKKMKMLQTGDPVIYTPVRYTRLSDEWFSKLIVDALNIHVAQMPTLAYLTVCPSWSTRCTRDNHRPGTPKLYDEEVKHAESNLAKWSIPNACWSKTSYDKIGITHNCSQAPA